MILKCGQRIAAGPSGANCSFGAIRNGMDLTQVNVPPSAARSRCGFAGSPAVLAAVVVLRSLELRSDCKRNANSEFRKCDWVSAGAKSTEMQSTVNSFSLRFRFYFRDEHDADRIIRAAAFLFHRVVVHHTGKVFVGGESTRM
jgi:hypothetical protein